MQNVTNWLFLTLTYARDRGCRHTRWQAIHNDLNRYQQKLKRGTEKSGQYIEYLAVIESHKDRNPHAHVLLYFTNPIRVEKKRFISNILFTFIESQWTHGHAKVEVLKHSNVPEFAFNYCFKYFLKQLPSENTVKEFRKTSGELPQIWKLRGRTSTIYGQRIRLLTWSRGMQHVYLSQQIKRLVLCKNITQSSALAPYHKRSVTKATAKVVLNSKDLALLNKYKPHTKHTNDTFSNV